MYVPSRTDLWSKVLVNSKQFHVKSSPTGLRLNYENPEFGFLCERDRITIRTSIQYFFKSYFCNQTMHSGKMTSTYKSNTTHLTPLDMIKPEELESERVRE
jgi:hypothetical protein